jgi:hypothetical protein
MSGGEGGDERALADPGVAVEQHDLSAGGVEVVHELYQPGELRVTLEEHRRTLPTAASRTTCQ